MLEANPRASRTVPFVSKATAVPLAKAAARIMLGATHRRAARRGPAAGRRRRRHAAAGRADRGQGGGAAVQPVPRPAGQGVDTVLGPEMRSTGEVMGIDAVFGTAFAKSQAAAYGSLPVKGRAFVSVANRDKRAMIFPVKRLADLGFEILATEGTAEVLRRNGVRAKIVRKHSDGPGPTASRPWSTRILAGEVDLIVNTPFGSPGNRARAWTATRSAPPRSAAASRASPRSSRARRRRAGHRGLIRGEVGVRSLQEHAAQRRGRPGARPCGGAAAWPRCRSAAPC